MRIFDSQKRVTWFFEKSMKKDGVRAPFRFGPKKSAFAEIGSAAVSSIKIIGRKVSGDGAINLIVKDDKNIVVLSKSFKFTKNSSSEVSFDSDIDGTGLKIFIVKPASSIGTICIDRVLAEGVLHDSRPPRDASTKVNSVNYAEITKALSRSLNLAVIVPYGIYGGGEVYIKNLISNGHKDFNIDVLFVAKNRLQKELEGCPVNTVGLRGLSGLDSYLRSDRYDAIVFYNSKKIYDILRKKKLQENFSADIIEIYHSDFLWSDAVSSIRYRECVDKLFRVSSGLAQDIVGVDEKDKVCVPVGVDPERFKKRHVWPNDVSESFERTIGMVARLSAEKNINYAMDIMKRIPGYQLVVLGAGPLLGELEGRKKAEGISNVTFVGHKDLVEQYYNIFDALLLTSRIEGTPISIVEALMCGLPIFTTPVGQIEHNYAGLSGVTWLSGDAETDAEALRSFDYNGFSGDELKSFSANKHGLGRVRDLFFSNILNHSLLFSAPCDGTLVLEGEYI